MVQLPWERIATILPRLFRTTCKRSCGLMMKLTTPPSRYAGRLSSSGGLYGDPTVPGLVCRQ
eukprot:529903-Pyramimonas_sp.AAC.1